MPSNRETLNATLEPSVPDRDRTSCLLRGRQERVGFSDVPQPRYHILRERCGASLLAVHAEQHSLLDGKQPVVFAVAHRVEEVRSLVVQVQELGSYS